MEKRKENTEKKISKTRKKEKNSQNSTCSDKLCPFHGANPLKLRGRVFKGEVVKKLHQRVVILFERMVYVNKYERYEKRRTKLHARLPDCLKDEIQEGDLIKVAECRPLSKMIHFVVIGKSKSGGKK
jgi:small subunit ribosomal protein S17